MTPWFILQFLASPVSMVMHVTGRQRQMLAVTITGLMLRVGAMLIAYEWSRSELAEIFALSGGIFYLLCCVIFYRVAGVGWVNAARIVKGAVRPLLFWFLAGLVVNWVVGAIL